MRVQSPKCAYDPYRKFDPIKNGVYNLVEVSVLNFNYLVSVTAGGPVSPEGTCNQVLRSTSVDSKRLESIKIFSV